MAPNEYAKATVGGISMGLGSAAVALNDGVITPSEWVTIAIAVVGAFGVVFGIPNGMATGFDGDEDSPGRHEAL